MKQVEANEAAWIKAKERLESEWIDFETAVVKNVGSFGTQVEQQRAIFKVRAAAQLKAWREAADKFRSSAKEFAAERRGEVEAAAKRMEADAAMAEAETP
jgi:hypothetical protein